MNRSKSLIRPFRLASALGTIAVTAALFGSAGCEKEDTIHVYNAPKEAAPPTPASVAAKPIDFSVPKGWAQADAGTMEYAHFKISPDDPKAAVTVSTLPTQEGLLLPNVNRWQRQLKLPESPESELPNVVKDIDLPGGKAQLIDLTGPEPPDGGIRQRTVAVILPHGPQTWYLKLAGPAPLVEAQRSKFDEFLKSVQFPASSDGDTTATPSADAGTPAAPSDATTEPAGPSENLTKWTAPGNWAQQTINPGSPRLLSFKVTSDDKPGELADVSVTRMSVDNLDALQDDVDMWRGQVGLPAGGKINTDDLHKVPVGGKEGALFEFAGPQADKPAKRVVVAMMARGRDLWFFKLAGPAGLVAAQKAGFLSFLGSTEFAPQ